MIDKEIKRMPKIVTLHIKQIPPLINTEIHWGKSCFKKFSKINLFFKYTIFWPNFSTLFLYLFKEFIPSENVFTIVSFLYLLKLKYTGLKLFLSSSYLYLIEL